VRQPHAAMNCVQSDPRTGQVMSLGRGMGFGGSHKVTPRRRGVSAAKLAAPHTHLSTRSAVFGSVGCFGVFVRAASSTVTARIPSGFQPVCAIPLDGARHSLIGLHQ
jgi:hypothetical protein